MYSDGHEVDGSWVLRVYVTDLQVERSLRVKGELHIGGVMLRLVEDLDKKNMKGKREKNTQRLLHANFHVDFVRCDKQAKVKSEGRLTTKLLS
ncbi:FERM2 protein, partial [Pseudoatta argentina]